MNKPDIKEVLELVEMKKEAARLYTEVDNRIDMILSEFGAGRFDYDLEQFIDEHSADGDFEYDETIMKDGRYLKLEIVDNAQQLRNGVTVFSSVSFKPVSFKAQSLKRCPDSLK